MLTHDGRPVTTVAGGGCTPSTTFQIASVSKNFAAMLTMMLVEEGLLDLHEPLDHWLPEAPRSWHALSLHHLLSHSSGIGHWQDVPGMDPFAPKPRDEWLKCVLRAPLQSAPGARFRYSSPAFLPVAVVAERATNSSYQDLLAQRILRPLGLTSTVCGVGPPDAARGHRAGRPVEAWDLTSMVGMGDLWSTPEDLVAYSHAVESGALVSTSSLALMRTRHAIFPEPDRSQNGRLEVTGYGYGHYVGTFDGKPATLHLGDNPGYTSLVGWLPGGVGIVALSNDDSTDWVDDVLPHLL
jgi:CubicO group peptidase (beta-lactamase class C family)